MHSLFTDQLNMCECCPRKCRVDRLKEETGFCKIGSKILISHAGLHYGEEPPISGTQGSGTIFFTGCNMRCVFCQNYQISQEFVKSNTRTFTIKELAFLMLEMQEKGAHNVNFVSPSHMIFQMADAIIDAKRRGFNIPVVYNSNGYDSVSALKQIRELVDVYLVDIKYLDNKLGEKFSRVKNYANIVREVIIEMVSQVGNLQVDEHGIAVKGLLVRHLVLPEYLENSRKCLKYIADISQNISVSIMSQYSPQYKAKYYPEINRKLTKIEYDGIVSCALDLGLNNALTQELDSSDHYLPDFDVNNPFHI